MHQKIVPGYTQLLSVLGVLILLLSMVVWYDIQDFDHLHTDADRDLLMQTYKVAGYRFELTSLWLPQSLSPGAHFAVISQ
ncbi:MAG TPA: hypothetical protein VKR06_26600 [Ktedonosporobacter sp.]|nr:hypothetical protein [Ktedonosporobacter sp.]